MATSYKLAKEAFVSGLGGTSLWEVSLITVTLASGYVLRSTTVVCLPAVQRMKEESAVFSFLLDYTAIIVPGVLIFTVLADYSGLVLALMLTLTLALLLYRFIRWRGPVTAYHDRPPLPYPRRAPFATVSRAYINLFTAIAILAVDFPIFPRRLAKAETYGTGLMDVGVGAFLMAHGVTAPEARYPEEYGKVSSLRVYGRMLVLTVKSVLPLFVLGLLRLAAVKSAGYQEHVTEYGVHWNFFFTIAVVRLLCTALHPLLPLLAPCYPHALLALLLAGSYQASLSLGGLEDYLHWGPRGDGSRPTLFSANREGPVTCIGYLGIYAASIAIGKWLLKPRRSLTAFLPTFLQLVLLDAALWILTSYSGQISRRFVNLPYILWILSYGCMMLVIFLATDLALLPLVHMLGAPPPSPLYREGESSPKLSKNFDVCIISALDYNQLLFFLLANVFTGAVNVLFDTLHTSPALSLAILMLYMLVLCICSVLLHRFRIKIKL